VEGVGSGSDFAYRGSRSVTMAASKIISRMPRRICDICLNVFNDIHVDRCDNCLLSYCKECVPEGAFLENCEHYLGISHRFCSRICRKESLCKMADCMTQFLARLRVYSPPSHTDEGKKDQ
jgi:hypothetical protein